MNPPGPDHHSRLVITAQPDAPSHARRHLRYLARAWALPPGLAESAELIVSELVTNALQHARRNTPAPALHGTPARTPSTDTIVLTLRQTTDILRIEVADHDATPPHCTDPDTDAEHGRGLLIVAALAKQWGWVQPVDGGKAVWCELVVE